MSSTSGKIGRNDPCPCGSGKKYKRCCLAKGALNRIYSQEERISVRARLEDFASSDAGIRLKEAAADTYWGPFIDEKAELAVQGLLDQSEDAFNAWLWFDYRMFNGRRMVDSFLEYGPSLTVGEHAYLERMRHSAVRLYEVEAVVPGASVTLHDMLGDRSIRVRERLGSQSMNRWDVIAARLTPMGASGQPEIEDVIPLPRFQVTSIIDAVREEFASWCSTRQDAGDLGFFEDNAPRWHQLWLQALLAPQVPAVRMNDGEQALITRTHFGVVDAAQAIKTLDAAPDMERDGEQSSWHWQPRGAKKAQPPIWIHLQGDTVIVEVLTKGSGERARKRVERLLGRSVCAGLTSHQDLRAAMADLEEGDARLDPQPGGDYTELDDAVLEGYEQHYRRWIDEPVPALDDHTPREAAKSDNLRPVLVRLLKDLEHLYCRGLELGQPAYDASWMWDELDLADTPGSPKHPQHPPPLGHESMARLVPGFADVIRAVAERMRRTYGVNNIERVMLGEELAADLRVRRFLEDSARQAHAQGVSVENAVSSANLLGMHIEYACNFELHRRKTFWIEEGLAWMLSRTNLDIVGDALRPPFAYFALIFTDRDTLALAERLLSKEDPCTHRGRLLRVLTVYVTEFQDASARGLRLVLTFDDLSEDWPYLLCRDLRIDADAHLDTLLESRFPDVDPQQRDPVFDSLLFKRILQRVLNAILYATSTGAAGRDTPTGPPAESRHRAAQDGASPAYSSEEVYYLPGHIDIRELRQLQNLSRSPGGGQLMHRFLVRGHWRRPNPSWKDQRPRWIKPYWKGPDVSALIERSYRLRPPDAQGET